MTRVLFSRPFAQGQWKTFAQRPNLSFFGVKQVHGANVIPAGPGSDEVQADGIIGTYKQTLAIVTADCLPILFLGPKQYGFVHAGWKGLKQHIISSKAIGSIGPLEVFIGPGIQMEHYAVGSEFKQYFPNGTFVEKMANAILTSRRKQKVKFRAITQRPLSTFAPMHLW